MNSNLYSSVKHFMLLLFFIFSIKDINAQLEYPEQVDTLGPIQTVFDFSTQGIPNDLPDAPARAFRDASGQIQLLAVHYDAYRMKGNDFNSLTKDYSNGPLFTSGNSTIASEYDYQTWLASPYTIDGVTIYSINHHEYFGASYNYYNWHNTITQAVSTDSGKTYQQASTPNHLIWSLPYSYSAGEGPCGYFNPSNIIQNQEDGYYYSYIHLEARENQESGVGLIRTNNLADPASWRGWDGTDFYATSYNPYSGGSVNPDEHVLVPLNDLNDNIGTMSSSITYNTYFNKWLLVGMSSQVINGVLVNGVFFSLSADMIHWSQRKLLRAFSGVWGATYPSYNYPSIIDHNDTSRNFSFSGQDVYLYYTKANSASDRDLIRIPIRFNKHSVNGFTVDFTTDNITTCRDALNGDGYPYSKLSGGTKVTLRSAIEEANARPPYYADSIITINFTIPSGTGVKNITLGVAELPEIKYPIFLNGTSQPGSALNTATSGQPNNAAININLDCNGNLGINFISSGSIVKGMAIYNANGSCLSISEGDGNTVQGCYIGITNTGLGGTFPVPGVTGIEIGGTANNGSANNTIGGINPEDQNVIVGGINLRGSKTIANIVQGNYIGTDKTGLVGIDQNSNGIGITDSSSYNLIGGSNIAMRNVISGNHSAGINLFGSETAYNTVINNYIGINATATAALPNQSDGITIQDGSHHNSIGLVGAGNIIAGGSNTILLIDEASNNSIIGNYIGTDTSGTINLGSGIGVEFKGGNCNDNLLGGEGAGENNIIANADFGVITFGAGARNSFINNLIYNINEIAIDLGWDGLTINDYQDTDPDSSSNPNNYFQNYPENIVADSVSSGVHITAQFNSTPNQQYSISFYASSALTGTGMAQAERFIGSTTVNSDANGDAPIDITLPVITGTDDYISLLVTDMYGNTSEFSDGAQVIINNNNPPISLSMSSDSIEENSSIGTFIATLNGVDPDVGNTLNYTFINGSGSGDNGKFSISGDQLLSNFSIDYETQSTFYIRLRCSDQLGAFYDENFTISVVDVNEAPDNLTISSNSIDENMASGTNIGTFSTTDQDAGDAHSYALVSGSGSTNNNLFTINSGQLKSSAGFNYEALNTLNIRVRSTDSGGLSYERTISINVNNLNENPTNLLLSASSINENSAIGNSIGSLSSTDEDAGDSHTYSLISGIGSDDNSQFTINGSQLRNTAGFDYETQNNLSIRVRTTDSGSLSFEKVISINVNNVNEVPSQLAISSDSIEENEAINTGIGSFSIIDPDFADTHTYSLVSGTGDDDNAEFNIASGILLSSNSFDFETKSQYSIRVRGTDVGGLYSEQQIIIYIIDVIETPTYILSKNEIQYSPPIFPNPSNGNFNIQMDNSTHNPTKIILLNQLGQECDYKMTRTGNLININAENLVPGIYSLRIIPELGQILSAKIIISK